MKGNTILGADMSLLGTNSSTQLCLKQLLIGVTGFFCSFLVTQATWTAQHGISFSDSFLWIFPRKQAGRDRKNSKDEEDEDTETLDDGVKW